MIALRGVLVYFVFQPILLFGIPLRDSYGKYRVDILNYTLCHGSKKHNSVNISVQFAKAENGTYNFLVNGTIAKPIGAFGGRFKLSKLSDGNFVKLLEYRVQNLCQHFIYKFAKQFMPPVEEKTCQLEIGNFSYVGVNYDKLLHLFFGEEFFYSTYILYTDFFGISEGYVCVATRIQIEKVQK